MSAFAALTSRSVVLRQSNIDTDQIIPARSVVERKRAGMIWSVSMLVWRSTTLRELRVRKPAITPPPC